MSEMVEKLAKVLFEADGRWRPYCSFEEAAPDDDMVLSPQEHYRSLARAAIESMREPTGLMFQEGRRVDIMALRNVTSIWQAMIDEALK